MTDARPDATSASILHLEDSDLDAELVQARLVGAGLRVQLDRATNRAEFIKLLDGRQYDLILADFQVPGFDGFAALELSRVKQPDTPFVFLSGAMGEEVAIETLKRGATDYVLKQRLARLPAAIDRALAEARERSQRKEAQERMRVSEAAMAEAQRIARLGSWSWNRQSDAIAASEEFWRIFCNGSDARPQTFHAQRGTMYLADSWDALCAAMLQSLESGNGFELDLEGMRAGERIWLTVRGEVVAHADGISGMRGTVQDITERKRTEELIRRNYATTALLRAAVESANDAVMITEANLDHPGPRIEYVNYAFERMTGYSSSEAIGATPRLLQGPKTDADLLLRLRRDLENYQEFSGETTNYRKDGSEYVVEWRITPVRDEQGGVKNWVAVQRDVTERRRSEVELREADRRKDEFLATLAHELRNPLAPIRNGLAVLRMDERVGSDGIITMMDRQLSHMVRLVDDLLDVSRVISGKVSLRREMVSIQRVIDSAIETSRPLVEAGRHQLVLSIPAEPLLVSADPTRIAQVISNLLNNSAKYSPDGGRVELEVGREDKEVVVRIRDHGVGIPTDMLPRVFELFTQVGRSLDRAQGGLGIGLSLVKRLVELHGGRIEAASEGPGKGSTFTVWLPLAHERRHTPRSEPVHKPSSTSRRILVVDDNTDGAESMALMLRMSGHETRVANDGFAALDSARGFEPDVVLLDIGMPGMSGYEVAERGRSDGTFRGTVLVAVTGWGSDGDKQRARDAGFDFHLTKPVEASAVARLLGELENKIS